MHTERLVACIDGFNLYHGLRDARLRSSRWLDLRGMCTSLLKPSQQLELVRYFTARVRRNPAAARRQSMYMDALLACGGIEIDFGHFLSSPTRCRSCGAVRHRQEEKRTDVNIAVRLLEDAYDDRFDTAMVVSGDSDLVPPIESVRHRFPDKRVLVAALIVDRVVADIDSIVRQVRFPGWQRTEAGEREVKKALRRSLLKYKLHSDQDLFDRAYAYIEKYY